MAKKIKDTISYSSYLKLPRELMVDSSLKHLSIYAKLLYALMLDRLELSVKNDWIDQSGQTYIIMSHKDAADYLLCSQSKVKKCFCELVDHELIKSKKQGLGKPNLIYFNTQIFAKNTSLEGSQKAALEVTKKPSREVLKNSLEGSQKATNNNKYNNNKNNNTNLINQSKEQSSSEMIEEREEYKDLIKDLISYDYFIENNYNPNVINCIVDASVNMLCSDSPVIRIGKRDIPYREVKRRIYKLDFTVVDYLYDNLKEIRHKIKNPTNYLNTTIYNAVNMHCMGFA